MPDTAEILIICVGNVLLLDEGFGPRVALELTTDYRFSPEITILDCGVMGMAILPELRKAKKVLIVDALDNTGQPPGTLFQFKPEDLADRQVFHTAHDIRMADVLNAALLMGINPQITCLGVQVENISPPELQIALTPAVEAALPQMVDLVIAWLADRGVTGSRLTTDN